MSEYTELELEAYLDEALSPADMAELENAIRDNPELTQQLSQIISRRDAGMHSVGAVWRRHRVSCPPRTDLTGFLLGTLTDEANDYLQFHLETVGCRICHANLEDLKRQQQETADEKVTRRKRYFQSSAGHLKDYGDDD